jgi:hypothetical protein
VNRPLLVLSVVALLGAGVQTWCGVASGEVVYLILAAGFAGISLVASLYAWADR